jgi:uncharacterized protein DUF5335
MAGEEIQRNDWVDFLELLTKEHEGWYVTIEVLTRDFGDQHEAERLPFVYVEYDYKDEVVIVAVGGRDGKYPVVLRHLISQPEKLFVHPPRPELAHAVDVVDKDGVQTVVSLYDESGTVPPH